MARVNVKYQCGQRVNCLGVPGTITAIFIRGKGRTYEFSYLDTNNNPVGAVVTECELTNKNSSKIGFGK